MLPLFPYLLKTSPHFHPGGHETTHTAMLTSSYPLNTFASPSSPPQHSDSTTNSLVFSSLYLLAFQTAVEEIFPNTLCQL